MILITGSREPESSGPAGNLRRHGHCTRARHRRSGPARRTPPAHPRRGVAVAALPLDELPSLIALAHQVRLAWCGPEVELESLINAKSGACPEDCAFCSQSVRYHTGVDVYAFLDLDEILDAARATRDAGATQFCIVVAVRGPEERLLAHGHRRGRRGAARDRPRGRVLARPADARAGRAARRPRACAATTTTSRRAARCSRRSARRTRYDDRVATARLARDAGMELCCGGILGMGETLEQRVDFAFELAELDPCEVPINLLDPRPGTPLADQPTLSPARGAAGDRAVPARSCPARGCGSPAAARRVLGELQGMGLLAGANALIVGNYLTTIGRSRRGRPRAARRARHARRRRSGRRPLRRRRRRRARAPAPAPPVDPRRRLAPESPTGVTSRATRGSTQRSEVAQVCGLVERQRGAGRRARRRCV